MTIAELATASGSTEERIVRLVELGVIGRAFEPGDVQRVRLAEALDRAGIPFEALGRAVGEGALSFDFVPAVLGEPPGRTSTTYRDEAERLGLEAETLVGLYPAWGLPRPEPDDRIREDEATTFEEFARFIAIGPIEERTLRRAANVTGDSARRLANWGLDVFRAFVEDPIRSAGGTPRQILDAGAAFGALMEGSLERQFLWLLRRAIEHQTFQRVVELVEEAIESAGIAPPRPARPPAIVFVDLSGYAALTEAQGDEAAADHALVLGSSVQDPVGRFGGDVIKSLGDGVLLHFPDPPQAVRCALELVERLPDADLPPAHVGIDAGPVIWRDGDCFGRTVNIASRIVGVARAGEVIVAGRVVEAAADASDLTFEDRGHPGLKGVTTPIALFRALRSNG